MIWKGIFLIFFALFSPVILSNDNTNSLLTLVNVGSVK